MTAEQLESAKVIYRFYDRLGWCRCGNPETVMKLMRDVLDTIAWNFEEARSQPYEGFKAKMEGLLGEIGGGISLTYFYLLDNLGLTEHGGGLVNGGWLTTKGAILLEHLKTVGDEEWDTNEIYELIADSDGEGNLGSN